MFAEFESVHNYYEQVVFREVLDCVAAYPQFLGDTQGLADVACLALNRLPSRYIRHPVDMNFFTGQEERAKIDAAISAAVQYAFRFMQSRAAHPGRQ
jgi:hypothetical protein